MGVSGHMSFCQSEWTPVSLQKGKEPSALGAAPGFVTCTSPNCGSQFQPLKISVSLLGPQGLSLLCIL